jgi:hypothetical protein
LTTFFGVPAAGHSVVYVVDRSASMGLGGRLGRAAREVTASLRRLPSSARFQVIAYGRAAEPLRLGGPPGLVAAEAASVEAAAAALGRLTAEGGTDHRRALRAGLALDPDVIYFLTDEDDFTPADVNDITAYNRGRTVIHAICLVGPASPNSPLAELTRRNGGAFRTAD